MTFKGVFLLICLYVLCSVDESTSSKARSLFDDLLVEKKVQNGETIEVYDSLSSGSKCEVGKICSRNHQLSGSRSVANDTSLFSSIGGKSKSLTSTLLQQNKARPSKISSHDTIRSYGNKESLLDKYTSSNGRSAMHRNSYGKFPHSYGTPVNKPDVNYQKIFSILQKERQAIQSLPQIVKEQAIQTTKKNEEKDFYDKLLKIVGDYAGKIQNLPTSTKDDGTLFTNEVLTKSYISENPTVHTSTLFDQNLLAMSNLLDENKKHFEEDLTQYEKQFVTFVEDIKKSRVQDLLLALKIMKYVNTSHTTPNKEEDKEIELLLAKSLIKREVGQLSDLSEVERSGLDSVIKAMNGNLNGEEKMEVMERVSQIFPFVDNKSDKLFLPRDYSPGGKGIIQPIGPTIFSTTQTPIIIGPPSPPTVGPPSPPDLFSDVSNFDDSDEVLFIPSNSVLQSSYDPTRLQANENRLVQNNNNNILPSLNQPLDISKSNRDSLKFHRLVTQNQNSNANTPVKDQNIQNFHYHYFNNPSSTNQNTRSKDVSSERAFFLPSTKSSSQLPLPAFPNRQFGQSTYASLNAGNPVRAKGISNLQAQTVPLRNLQLQQNHQTVGVNSPNNFGAPAAPASGYRQPAAPANTYGPPVSNPPRQTYGAPPRNPPMSYGPPQAPRQAQEPVRTRVVFLRPNKKAKKGFFKKGKGGGDFSAFSVLFGGSSDAGLNNPNFRNVGGYSSRRDVLRDEFWRSRQRLFRYQQDAFEIARLRADIQAQEKQREGLKRGLFKRLFTEDLADDVGSTLFKGAMAIGALSLFPLYNMLG